MGILRATVILLVGLVLILAACVGSTETPRTISPPVALCPSSPIKVELSISKLPILNEPVDLTCNVTSGRDAPNSTAQIKLSEGTSLINGNLEWQGDLIANIPVSLSAQIVFEETGHHTIEATAIHVINDNNSWGDIDAIFLDIGTESSTFGWPVSPVPVVMVPDKYSVIQTDLEISHAPKLNEPAKLFITIFSPVDFPNLTAEIIFHEGVELLEGAKKQPIDLKAGVPVHFSATIIFTETGYRKVTADVCEQINNVWYHSPQDTIYLKIGVNESTFEQEPPKETSDEDLPPPPAIEP